MIAYIIVALVIACGVAVGLWRYERAQRITARRHVDNLALQLRREGSARFAAERARDELQRIVDQRAAVVAKIESERAALHAEVAQLAAGIDRAANATNDAAAAAALNAAEGL